MPCSCFRKSAFSFSDKAALARFHQMIFLLPFKIETARIVCGGETQFARHVRRLLAKAREDDPALFAKLRAMREHRLRKTGAYEVRPD